MVDLSESSRAIDIITLPEELDRRSELETIGGVAYISSLLDGVPDRPSIEHYIKSSATRRCCAGLIHAANAAIVRASEQSDPAEEIVNDAEASILQLSEKRIGRGFSGRAGDRQRIVRLGRRPATTRPTDYGTRHALHRSRRDYQRTATFRSDHHCRPPLDG